MIFFIINITILLNIMMNNIAKIMGGTGVGYGIYTMLMPKPPINNVLNLKDFKRVEAPSRRALHENKAIRYTYYDPQTDKEVGYIDFTPKTGRIGFWSIYEDYRHKSLGKQMLKEVIPVMKENGAKKVHGYTDAEEVRTMSEHDSRIKRVDRGTTGFDYYEMSI